MYVVIGESPNQNTIFFNNCFYPLKSDEINFFQLKPYN